MNDTFLGHPRGLLFCALTEMWEFFSYFGMRALLIFFLTQRFHLDDTKSYAIYGAFIGLSWALPVVGGALADHYLGAKRAIIAGGISMAVGYFLLAADGAPGITQSASRTDLPLDALYLSLGLIIAGAGLLKSNLTTLVGALYDSHDPRRDSGYTLYYLGANFGGAAAPMLCGWLGHTYGWAYGFGVAGIGMLVGLLIFLRGQRHLGLVDPSREPVEKGRRTAHYALVLYPGILLAALLFGLLIEYHKLLGAVLSVFALTMCAIVGYLILRCCSASERRHMIAILSLSVFAILFFAFYEQMGSSLNLFMDRFVELKAWGCQVQASQMISLASIFVLILAPLFSALWLKLERRHLNPPAAVKISLGTFFLGLAFFMPVIGAFLDAASGRVNLIWIVLMFFFMECGELCTVPIAFSIISRLSPQRFGGAMMGGYFFCVSLGSFASAKLAALTSVGSVSLDLPARALALENYVAVYARFGIVLTGIGGLIYSLWLALSRFVRDVELPDSSGNERVGRTL